MDDLWGDDDLDADVVEECVLLATQASFCSSPKPQQQETSFTECKSKFAFEFKQPSTSHYSQVQQASQKATSSMSRSMSLTEPKISNNIVPTNLVDAEELEKLKEENRRLSETNLVKNGETTILRADLQNIRSVMEKREVEASQQIASLQKKVAQIDTQYSKQLEASKTEMKFKELELEELRNKCKKIEQNVKEQQKNIRAPSTQAQESPNGRKFLNRTTFEMTKNEGRKIATVETGVQTEAFKRFRLDSSNTELGLDNATDTAILIETLKFSLLSSVHNNGPSYTTVLEQLKMRMISSADQENLVILFHSSEPSVAEMICNNLESLKNTDRLKSHVEFLGCWITHILPYIEKPKQDRLIQTVLSEIRRTSFIYMMSTLSAIIACFGLAPVCNRQSGCLLEKVALNLKDAYPSLTAEDQFQAAQKLVLTLSTMLASPATENMKKCLCIPHLLKSLVYVVQHQTEIEGLTPYAADRRLKMLVQAFRLSRSILSSRREPWLTYKHSPAEVNRLYTVLTAIVEFPLPNDISHEINGTFRHLLCLDLDCKEIKKELKATRNSQERKRERSAKEELGL